MNYECHITCALKDAVIAEQVAHEHHWSTSQIERDPVLGKASYFYLTTHDQEFMHLYQRMASTVRALADQGVSVVREKIELIMHDKRTSR